MKELIFSEENIQSLIENNLLDINELVEQFHRSNLISHTRYVYSMGAKSWGSWERVSIMINKFLSEKDWKFEPSSETFNVNVAYFAPSIFLKLKEYEIIDIINNLNQQQLVYVLVKDEIMDFFITLFKNPLFIFVLRRINPIFFINLLLALTKKNYVSIKDEINLISLFIKANSKINSTYKDILEFRLNSLKNKVSQGKNNNSKNMLMKIALLICGQLRGYEEAIPRFASKFRFLGSVDAYISTWDNIGSTRFNAQNSYRIFEKEACDFIAKEQDIFDFSKFDTAINSYLSNDTIETIIKDNISNYLQWCNLIQFNIKKYTEYPYNLMSNSEKMYYHNAYWVNTLGEEYFKQYDLIIKIRPDYFFKDSTPLILDKRLNEYKTLITDTSNYLFLEWGFGMGDQLWIGKPDSILPILKCHNHSTISYQFTSNTLEKGAYHGYINCGLEAWGNALSLLETPSSLQKSRLSGTKLIPLNVLRDMDIYK